MEQHKQIQQLNCCSFAIACGIVWGTMIFSLTIFNLWGDLGTTALDVIGSLYVGLDYTIKGSLIGLLWGLGHGLLFGWLIAKIYNCCNKHVILSCCNNNSCKASTKK